jgi:iron(III) transport system substrate-binding protein
MRLVSIVLFVGMVLGIACQSGASSPRAASPTVGTTTAAVSADGDAWTRTVAAARQEGRVFVIGPGGDIIRRSMVEGFRKAYPDIALEWLGGRPPEMASKVEAERRAGVYSVDVFLGGTATALFQMRPIGALDPIKPALILPEVADPKSWRDGRFDFSDAEELNLVFANTPSPLLAYQPSRVTPEEIDELAKLLEPRWRGQIAISDPIPAGSGNAAFRLFWHGLGPSRGEEFARALRAQASVVDREERRLLEGVALGRHLLLIGPNSTLVEQLIDEGLNIGVRTDFKEVGGYLASSSGTLMRINQAPHPNAQQVFINWLLGKEGQTAWSIALNQPSLRVDVATDHLRPQSVPQPGVPYWRGYTEEAVQVPPALGTLLRELFAN